MVEERSFLRWPRLPGRVGAGAVVALAHVAVLFGLSAWSPAVTRVIEAVPLQVQLLSQQPESRVEPWQPPAPKLVSIQPVTLTPPEVEVPIEAPPPAQAITLPSAPPPPPAANRPGSEPKLVSEVAYIEPPAPRYPPESKRSREQGLVTLRVLIDERGRAREVRIHRSSGFSRLDAAAREAVARAVFKPYIEGGVAQPAIVIIPIEFSLNTRNALARNSRG